MTFAWYGHLKYRNEPLGLVIVVSWGIALFEYAFQVPANRIGAERFTVTQLKIIQECITLAVFTIIAYLLFHEPVKWNTLVSYTLIVGAVYFAFVGQKKEGEPAIPTDCPLRELDHRPDLGEQNGKVLSVDLPCIHQREEESRGIVATDDEEGSLAVGSAAPLGHLSCPG